jgi:prepilin-type N-terminal cleavage/methylation domain-containing protein
MKSNKGFTLIELLVVIAIIGILSSVVLASLNTARDKGADAAAKANLNGIRAQAELVYDDDGDYALVCSDPNVSAAVTAAGEAGANQDCQAMADAWAAEVQLSDDTWYCVDSRGTATTTEASATSIFDLADDSTTTAACL